MEQLQPIIDRVNMVYRERNVEKQLRVAFGFRVESLMQFALTPDRPYLGRADVDLLVGSESVQLITLAMMDGDGTGNESTYQADSLTIPKKYQRLGTRAIPRRKNLANGSPLPVEGAIPLFSFNPSGTSVKMFDSTLLELWLRDGHLVTDIAMMTAPHDSPARRDGNPHMFYTVWHDRAGKRFGDPHAIVAPIGSNQIQVISFFAANNTRGNVFDLLNEKGMMPQPRRR